MNTRSLCCVYCTTPGLIENGKTYANYSGHRRAGFIGSNFVRMLLGASEPAKLVAFDKLTYAGNLANLQDLLERSSGSSLFEATSATEAVVERSGMSMA